MKFSYHTLSLFILLALLSSCTKEKQSASFSARPAVYFIYSTSIANMDSISYSFLEKSSAIQKDTLWFAVRAAGNAADHDRKINLVPVADSTTAVSGVHYQLLNYVMPKDQFTTNLGVVLIRDASLRNADMTLTLRLQPSEEFPSQVQESLMSDGVNYSRNRIRIIFSDRLTKPANWDNFLVSFFGAYSVTKYRFIAGVLGVSTFPNTGTNAVGYPKMYFYQTTARNALLVYNAANGPLIDENGQAVIIP